MKELWIQLREDVSEVKPIIEACSRNCDVLVVSEKLASEAEKLKVKTAGSRWGDVKILEASSIKDLAAVKNLKGDVAVKTVLKNREDENLLVSAAKSGAKYVIAACSNWKIIPLENLIAKIHGSKSKLIAEVSSVEEAKTALETLELGVDGVLATVSSKLEVEELANIIKKAGEKLSLVAAKVTNVKPISIGARVCVDTCEIMKEGEGLLVGSQSMGLFLIQAEVRVNPYVEPRPFRVNAGAISLYTLTPGNKTKYLSELEAGDEVLIVDRNGNVRPSNVCRVKIEYRPLILVEAEYKGRKLKVVLQNAETIRLVTSDGSKSVTELKPGDKVLVRFEEGGRHFGMLVKEETVIEK